MDGTVGSEATEEDDILAEFTDEELAEAAVSGAGLTEGGRSPRERKKVGRILGAAASVFARRGYSEARMDDVAEEAGVSKGGLYLHFPSKDALFDGLVGYLVGLEGRRLKAARAAEGPVADRLAGFFHEYARDLARMARFYPIVMEFYARSCRHAPLRRAMQRHIDVYVAELAALVREGIASGEFRQVDAEEVALQLISLLEGLALVWGIDRERVQIPETADRGVRLVLDGLLAR
jgi:AcrR family transcriptional regulator